MSSVKASCKRVSWPALCQHFPTPDGQACVIYPLHTTLWKKALLSLEEAECSCAFLLYWMQHLLNPAKKVHSSLGFLIMCKSNIYVKSAERHTSKRQLSQRIFMWFYSANSRMLQLLPARSLFLQCCNMHSCIFLAGNYFTDFSRLVCRPSGTEETFFKIIRIYFFLSHILEYTRVFLKV